jgi:chromosome segregation ATPase
MPKPSAAFAAVRARIEGIRQLARNWERWADSVETLLGERLERQSELSNLTDELQASRDALARASLELEAKSAALARLEATHAAVVRDREALRRALGELRERHDMMLRDRQAAIDCLEAAIRTLKS